MTDVMPAAESPAAEPLTGWRRRRDIAGQVLELSANVLRPGSRGAPEPGRLQRAAALAVSFLPHSVDSRRSIWSVRSMYSGASVASLGSFGSLLSAGSAGSILSIGSAGSVLSIGGLGRTRGPWAASPEGVATIHHLGTVAGAFALAGALASASSSS